MNATRGRLPWACILISGLTFSFFTGGSSCADESPLIQRQVSVSDRYQKLEKLLLRLADVEAAENPDRSALLRRAVRQSRDKFVLDKLRGASQALRDQKYQAALDNQGVAKDELQAILKLLMSEDRSKRIRDEKERVAKMIKDLKRIERAQRSTRARTENGADFDELESEQKSIGDRSQKLKNDIDKESEPVLDVSSSDDEEAEDAKQADTPKDSDSESDKKDDSEQQPDSESKQSEGSESKQNESEDKSESDAESKPASRQKPSAQDSSESKQQDSKAQPAQSQQSQQPQQQPSGGQSQQQQAQPQSPEQQAQQQLQQAIERMRQAEQQLEKSQRQAATEKQREAEENLRKAIDRLERILRQLREEEMQRELAKLESRLRKMAAMQSKVLDDTVALAATPKQQRNRQTDLKAGDLAFEEKKITLEADRAMLLLREEGSSVAFPEVIDQIRRDTVRVSELLGETKIDVVTQGIQNDILAALEEMIAALQKAQRELEQKQQQRQQNQRRSAQPGEQPLVDVLAELRLVRTMETRIKSTTGRYSGLLESGETNAEEVLPLLQDLSERQNRLYRITRDLVLKRNQ